MYCAGSFLYIAVLGNDGGRADLHDIDHGGKADLQHGGGKGGEADLHGMIQGGKADLRGEHGFSFDIHAATFTPIKVAHPLQGHGLVLSSLQQRLLAGGHCQIGKANFRGAPARKGEGADLHGPQEQGGKASVLQCEGYQGGEVDLQDKEGKADLQGTDLGGKANLHGTGGALSKWEKAEAKQKETKMLKQKARRRGKADLHSKGHEEGNADLHGRDHHGGKADLQGNEADEGQG